MSGHGTNAATKCCEVQPEGVPGGLAAERPRGHEHKTWPAKGQESSHTSMCFHGSLTHYQHWLLTWVKQKTLPLLQTFVLPLTQTVHERPTDNLHLWVKNPLKSQILLVSHSVSYSSVIRGLACASIRSSLCKFLRFTDSGLLAGQTDWRYTIQNNPNVLAFLYFWPYVLLLVLLFYCFYCIPVSHFGLQLV